MIKISRPVISVLLLLLSSVSFESFGDDRVATTDEDFGKTTDIPRDQPASTGQVAACRLDLVSIYYLPFTGGPAPVIGTPCHCSNGYSSWQGETVFVSNINPIGINCAPGRVPRK